MSHESDQQRINYWDKLRIHMTTYKADLGALDPIEKASRDEIEALQLERLKWTLNQSL